MRLGWVQACSTHMWEICNRPIQVANERWFHPCLVGDDRTAFVQIRYRDSSQALALAWASPKLPMDELIAAAQHLGAGSSVSRLLLALHPEETGYMPEGAEPAGEICVMENAVREGA